MLVIYQKKKKNLNPLYESSIIKPKIKHQADVEPLLKYSFDILSFFFFRSLARALMEFVGSTGYLFPLLKVFPIGWKSPVGVGVVGGRE